MTHSRNALAVVLPALLAACAGEQAVLAPAGPHAAQIASLSWLLFIGGAVIMLAVIAATALAMFGSARARTRIAGLPMIVAGGIAAPVIVLTGLLIYNMVLLRDNAQALGAPAATRIAVSGEQWWWRISYLDGDRPQFDTANEIRIPVDEDVDFILTSPDVIHSFWIPSLGGKADMIPGRSVTLRLRASRAGSYRGQCAEYCGGPHALMALPVIAMERDAFAAWRTREAADAAKTSEAGQALFTGAGCGACHTIRGTPANGKIGPDLTHFGARKSVALDTLPVTKDNVMQFITGGQRIKPGNTMPEYRVFSAEQLESLGNYLVSLQ